MDVTKRFAAALMLAGVAGYLIVSIALRMATRTSLTPRPWARSMAFWTMSTFTSSDGAMLIAVIG